jgi:hypothetical protein
MDMYLEVFTYWVNEAKGIPMPERRRLVEPGHVVLRFTEGEPVPMRVDKAMARYGALVSDVIRKFPPPPTPELGVYDVAANTMTWN